jgi:hypothetical protein
MIGRQLSCKVNGETVRAPSQGRTHPRGRRAKAPRTSLLAHVGVDPQLWHDRAGLRQVAGYGRGIGRDRRGARPFGRTFLDTSFTGRIAAISVETGISPNELLDTPAEILEAITELLLDRASQSRKAGR